MTEAKHAAGDELPPKCARIEVRVDELRQLFNAMDPSPFRERDLEPAAEEFIVSWAREIPRDAPLALVVYLDRAAGPPDEATNLRDSVHAFFTYREQITRRQLSQLFRIGRTSLAIGLLVLVASFALGDRAAQWLEGHRVGGLLREGILIGGWVAMWRPLEVFLYDWWPIRSQARLYRRLAEMPVRIEYASAPAGDAWRNDWPTAPTARA